MQFRTAYKITKPLFSLSHSHSVLFIGSCFTHSIGEWLHEYKFKTNINPFGITFNSISICKQIDAIIQNKIFSASDLFQHQNLFKSFEHHSSFNSTNAKATLDSINQSIRDAHEFLKKADYLFLTLGTSWVYEQIAEKRIANNCHKVDAKQFEKKFISVKENIKAFEEVLTLLKSFNPKLKVVFTVSPVRHLKDGFTENQISKSALLLTINELAKQHSNCFYFPAYEIMMDDLRDYRFYAEDMIHPNNVAIDYIKSKFSEMYFEENTKKFIKEYESLLRFLKHRPFEESEEYVLQKENILIRVKKLFDIYDIR